MVNAQTTQLFPHVEALHAKEAGKITSRMPVSVMMSGDKQLRASYLGVLIAAMSTAALWMGAGRSSLAACIACA